MKPTSHTILTLLTALISTPALAAVPAWTGGDNTWSTDSWDGQSISTSGEDVTFNADNPTVAVNGTVTPNSITFEQGAILANGTEGTVSTGAVIVNAGTVVTQIPLAAQSAALAEGTTLQYETGVDCTLDTVFTGDATTALRLNNSNGEGSVTYRLDSADMAGFHGTVWVGDSTGTDRTVVVTQNISQDYMLGKTSDLVLTGSGTGGFELIGGKVRCTDAKNDTDAGDKLDCTLTVAEGAKIRLDDGTGRMGVPRYMRLNVLGDAVYGSADTPFVDYNSRFVDVHGSLTVYFDVKAAHDLRPSATLPTFGTLTLHDNAVLNFHHVTGADNDRSFRPIITNLAVDGSAQLNMYGDVPSSFGRRMAAEFVEVTNLQGEGNLNIDFSTANRLQKVFIRNLGSSTENYYKGDICITTHVPGQAVKDEASGAYYDMGGYVNFYQKGVLDGVLRVKSEGFEQDGVLYGTAGFIIGSRIVSPQPVPTSTFSIHGIDDTGSTGKTFLASNGYNSGFAIADPNDSMSFEKYMYADQFMNNDYVLELTGNGEYSFGGTVYKKIAIVKNGTGTQRFSGDTSRIDQDITVNSGSLLFEDALATAAEAPINVTLNAGTLKLSGGNIASLTGAAEEHGATLILGTGSHGEVNDIDITTYTGHFDVQLEDGHMALRGGEGTFTFGDSLSSSGSSGIAVADGITLVLLAPINVSGGDLTMSGSFDVSCCTLVKDQSTRVDTAGRSGESGFVVEHVTIANLAEGARTIDAGTTLIHSGLEEGKTLQLGWDGSATVNDGNVIHEEYIMVEDFAEAKVSDINGQAQEALQVITLTDGTLTVDANTDKLNATGGTIVMTNEAILQSACAVQDTHIQAVNGTVATHITGTSDIAVDGVLGVAGAVHLIAGEHEVQITARGQEPATLSGKVDVNSGSITGGEGDENLVADAMIVTHSDFEIRDISLEGSVVDLAEGTTGYLYNVVICADSRITDDAAQLFVDGTKAILTEGNTNVSEASLLPEDVMLYRCGDTGNWAEAQAGLSLVDLTSELISKVQITGASLVLDMTGLSGSIGDADLVSLTFAEGAAFEVKGLRVYATLDGMRQMEAFVKQTEGYAETVYFFTKRIPEPATSTLGLLALCALAARRRRK